MIRLINETWLSGLLLMLMAPGLVSAQEKPRQVEEVTIVGDFAPSVTEANKINKNPVLSDTVIEMPQFQYSIISSPWYLSFPVTEIAPSRYKTEAEKRYQRNYTRLGFGNYTTPYVEFFAGKTQSKSSAFGLHFRHLSSQGDGEDVFKNGFSMTDFDAFGKIFTRSYAIGLEGAYNRHSIHYYGFDTVGRAPLTLPSLDSLHQVYNRFHAAVDFKSLNQRKGSLNHAFGTAFSLITDKFETNELCLDVHLDADLDVALFKGSRKQKLGVQSGFLYYNNQWAIVNSANSSLLRIAPFYNVEFDEYSLKLGALVEMASDSASQWNIYPDARAAITVIKDVLQVHAGVRGEHYKNSFNKITATNPFVMRELTLAFSNRSFELYGGFKSSFSRFVDFSGTFSSSKVENMALFYHPIDPNGVQNLMSVVYDDVTLMRVSGEFSFQKKESVRLIFGGAYQSARPTFQSKAWYVPEMEGWLFGELNLTPALKLKATAKAFSKMYARIDSISVSLSGSQLIEQIREIDPYVDLSVGAEYRFTDRFSAFLDFNNLLASRYKYWYGYKHYGLNFLGGVTFGF